LHWDQHALPVSSIGKNAGKWDSEKYRNPVGKTDTQDVNGIGICRGCL
jgi:hypothetical protein